MAVRRRFGGEDLEDRIAGGPPVGDTGNEPKPIGVPAGYEVAVRNQARPDYYPHGFNYRTRTYGLGAHPDDLSHTRGPRYMEGAQWRPASLPGSKVAELQRAMATAGLLDDFRLGVWDERSADAYSKVLAFANASGLTEQVALSQMINSPDLSMSGGGSRDGGGRRVVGFDENGDPIYEGPPPLQIQLTPREDIMRVARGVVIDRLGQGWSQDRLAALADAYQATERRVQEEAYAQEAAADMGMLSGQTVTQPNMPSMETFIEDEVRRQDPTGFQAGQLVNDIIPQFFKMLEGYS